MGCHQSKSKKVSTRQLLNHDLVSKEAHVYFSTECISNLDADCLLILSRGHKSLKDNQFIKSLPKGKVERLLSDYAAALETAPDSPGMIIYRNFIFGLEYQQICILHLSEKLFEAETGIGQDNIWLWSRLQEVVGLCGVDSLVITQMEWKKWPNKINLFKTIQRFFNTQSQETSIVFVCQNKNSQQFYMRISEDLYGVSQA